LCHATIGPEANTIPWTPNKKGTLIMTSDGPKVPPTQTLPKKKKKKKLKLPRNMLNIFGFTLLLLFIIYFYFSPLKKQKSMLSNPIKLNFW